MLRSACAEMFPRSSDRLARSACAFGPLTFSCAASPSIQLTSTCPSFSCCCSSKRAFWASAAARQEGYAQGQKVTGLVYEKHGEPQEVVKAHSWRLHALKEGQVGVKMRLASVNPADINVLQGVYPSVPSPRDIPGLQTPHRVGGNEGLGEVQELDEKGRQAGLREGDWVIFGKPQMGTWTSHMIAPASDLIPIPREAKENLTEVMGSTLMINPATAICMLRDFEQLKKGDVIVQNAANSAVGQAVVQLAARVLGVETINFVRDRPDLQGLRSDFEEWGRGGPGTHVFTYDALSNRETSSETKDAVKRIANGRPIKLALNALCGKDTTNMSKLLAPSASLVTYGAMSRSPLSLPASLLIFRDLKARGFWMSTWYAMHTRQERAALTAELAHWYAQAILAPPKANIITLTHDHEQQSLSGEAQGEKRHVDQAGRIISETMQGSQGAKTFLKFQ